MAWTNYKEITLEDMINFIEENHPEDAEWFYGIAYQLKDGAPCYQKDKFTKQLKRDDKGNPIPRYNHLNAKKAFCEKYMPDLLPKKQPPKPKATDLLERFNKAKKD